MGLCLNAGRQAEQWEDTYSFPWDALKMSNVREHLLLVSSLHPFLLILLSCCLNLCPAMRFFLFCVTVVSRVCLPHYSVIRVEWDEIWQCLRCCVSCPSDLESIFIFLVSKASPWNGNDLFSICPRRCCTSGWEPHQRARDMLIKHADSSAVAVSSAEEIN